jgi:MoxR-like ATPase
LLKLRNYFGPAALGFMAAYEGGVITDDVIRQGTPLNESLANNWLTKSFLPYTKDYAQAKNLLESGTVPSNMKKYVQDVVTFNEALKDMQGIENRVSSRLVTLVVME